MTNERGLNIIAQGIRLREINEGDLPKIVLWKNANRDKFIYQGKITIEGQEEWFEKYGKDPNDLMFVMVDKGETVGAMAVYNIDKETGTAEFGRVMVDERHLRKGYATKGCEVLLRYAFNKLGLWMIYLEVFTDNEEAIGLYKKCGFKIDDVIKKKTSKGKERNMYRMEITKEALIL